jgi:hypothetical protein
MQVLELIREVKEDEEEERNSDISGYHSETDSAIMMTGNSPFVTKNARTNFLQRSGACVSSFLLKSSFIVRSVYSVPFSSAYGVIYFPQQYCVELLRFYVSRL